nr:hypothetical protein [uncultured Campylobacter sp.]
MLKPLASEYEAQNLTPNIKKAAASNLQPLRSSNLTARASKASNLSQFTG